MISKKWYVRFFVVTAMTFATIANEAVAQSALQVAFGNKGVQTISYGGVVLDDVGAYPQDAFHI